MPRRIDREQYEEAPISASQLIEDFLQALVAGLLSGAIYGLMCVGLALIYGSMRVVNFAQGDFMMLSMYVAHCFFGLLGIQAVFGSILGSYIAVLLAAPVIFLFGCGFHRALMPRVTGMRTWRLQGGGHDAQVLLRLIDLRSIGMIAGIELTSIPDKPEARAYDAFKRAFAEGILIRTTGDIIALSPPLIFEKKHIDELFGSSLAF